jgi:hypothetical protein
MQCSWTDPLGLLSLCTGERTEPSYPQELITLSLKDPRYGYRRITALLRRDGFEINPKKVARIRREEGLKVSKRQKRTRRVGVSTAERLKAERPRLVWSWDFVEDQTENGSRFRILTLIDEYTRECQQPMRHGASVPWMSSRW